MNLKTIREKAGYTQADLAYHLGFITPQFISNVERGTAMLPLKHWRKAAIFLGVTPEVFLDAKLKKTEDRLRKVLRRPHGSR